MSLAGIAQLIASIGCMLALGWAGISDLKNFRIPNMVSIALIMLFVIRAPALGADESLNRLIITVVLFAASFGFYMAGFLGAGDSKLVSSFSLHIPVTLLGAFFVSLALGGIVLLLLTRFLRRTALSHATPSWRVWERSTKFPYGIALAVAGCVVLWLDAASFLGVRDSP